MRNIYVNDIKQNNKKKLHDLSLLKMRIERKREWGRGRDWAEERNQ